MTNRAETRGAAVVTGHSRGLGAAVATQLLDQGVRVLGISRGAARDREGLEQVRLDLSDADALHQWLRDDPLGAFFRDAGLAILVNNAGLLQPIGKLEQQDPLAVSRAVAVNVGAALALSTAFAIATERTPDRRILHVSSGAARHAYAGWSVYCATKAALDHHARAVVLDGSARLRIASVAPGVIDTEMQADIRRTSADRFPDRQRFVEMKEEGSLRSPDDAARSLVSHLFSHRFGDEPVTETRR